jgi:hypothetical protein
MGSGPATRAYVERRTKEGKSKAEIIRCLKRYVAREVSSPAPGRRLTHRPRGRPDPIFGCRETCRPSNDPSAVPGPVFLTRWT